MEDVIIMCVLAAILYLGVKMQGIAARRDIGQPWALHTSNADDRAAPTERTALESDAPIDAVEAVREAQEIVHAAHRGGY